LKTTVGKPFFIQNRYAMNRLYILLVALFTATACEKSVSEEEIPASTSSEMKANSSSSWQLLEYYQASINGEGEGGWVMADTQKPEVVTFNTDGTFSSNENWLWHSMNYDRYQLIQDNKVILTSSKTGATATFIYQPEKDNTLLFNGICRENCSRKYRKVG